MKRKIYKYIMLVLCALFAICLALGLYFRFNIINNPTDGIGGLHNFGYEMQSLLFLTIAIALGAVDSIMLVIFIIRKKKK